MTTWPPAAEPITPYPGEWHPVAYPPVELPRLVHPAPITDPALDNLRRAMDQEAQR